jgi:hypothetical protein
MKWNIKQQRYPRIGDRRTVRRFAFFPTRCTDLDLDKGVIECYVWLEYYTEDQEFVKRSTKERYMPDWITIERFAI